MDWTPELEDLCIDLWNNSDKSLSQIGDVLGVSRSAVAGKVRRLRRDGRDVKERKIGLHNEQQREAGRQRALANPSVPRPAKPVIASKPEPPLLLNIIDLGNRQCHYPCAQDQGVHLFCGQPAALKSDYCSFHHRVVWQPKH